MTKPKDPIGPLDDTTQIIRSAELDEKLRRADYVIDNGGDLAVTDAQVVRVYAALEAGAVESAENT